jgi:hypothetical protein
MRGQCRNPVAPSAPEAFDANGRPQPAPYRAAPIGGTTSDETVTATIRRADGAGVAIAADTPQMEMPDASGAAHWVGSWCFGRLCVSSRVDEGRRRSQ